MDPKKNILLLQKVQFIGPQVGLLLYRRKLGYVWEGFWKWNKTQSRDQPHCFHVVSYIFYMYIIFIYLYTYTANIHTNTITKPGKILIDTWHWHYEILWPFQRRNLTQRPSLLQRYWIDGFIGHRSSNLRQAPCGLDGPCLGGVFFVGSRGVGFLSQKGGHGQEETKKKTFHRPKLLESMVW